MNAKSKSRDLAEYFEKFATFTEFLFRWMIIVFVMGPFLFMLFPIYKYFTDGELIPIMPLFFPGIDEKTIIGYVVLNLYLLLISVMGITCLFALEFLMAIIIISSLIFAKLIGRQLQQMNVDLQDDDCEMPTIKGRLRNIFLMHQEMGEYMERIDKLTFRTFVVQIGTATFGAIVSFYPSFIVSSFYYFQSLDFTDTSAFFKFPDELFSNVCNVSNAVESNIYSLFTGKFCSANGMSN